MLTQQQKEDLAFLQVQATELANKPGSLTKQEERQYAKLLADISLVKSGATLEDLMIDRTNESRAKAGLSRIGKEDNLDVESRAIAEGFLKFFRSGNDFEVRDSGVGTAPLSGTVAGVLNGSTGSFVPTQFWYQVKNTMKAIDPLFNPDAVTFIETPKGGPIQIPYYSDIENVSVVVGEGSDQSGNETDINAVNAAVINAYSFRSPLWRVSVESFDDVATIGGIVPLFTKFCGDRTARGVGKLLVSGSGSGQPTGIITALQAAGVNPIVASGSSGNSGGTENGSNSIGSADVAKLVFAVDESYRRSDKCFFLCSDNVRQYLATLVTKFGSPLVNWYKGDAFMLGYPIRTSPSMSNIGQGNYPLVFGDFSYFAVRHVTCAPSQRVQLVKETVGLIEKGEVGLRYFDRYDSALLYSDTSAPSPFSYLVTHS